MLYGPSGWFLFANKGTFLYQINTGWYLQPGVWMQSQKYMLHKWQALGGSAGEAVDFIWLMHKKNKKKRCMPSDRKTCCNMPTTSVGSKVYDDTTQSQHEKRTKRTISHVFVYFVTQLILSTLSNATDAEMLHLSAGICLCMHTAMIIQNAGHDFTRFNR